MKLSFLLCVATPLILIISSITMMGFQVRRPNFSKRSSWLSAISATLIAWTLAILSRACVPSTISFPFLDLSDISLQVSNTNFLSSYRIVWLADNLFWVLSITLTTVLLSSLLTRLARFEHAQETSQDFLLSNDLLITAISLFTILAGNIFTLILGWMVLDSVLLIIRMYETRKESSQSKTAFQFSLGYLGTIVLIIAELITQSSENPNTLDNLSSTQSALLLIACAFRSGTILWQPRLRQEPNEVAQRSIVLKLTSIAATLMPMIRVASNLGNEAEIIIAPFLLILAASAAIFSSLAWLTASDELSASPFWISALSAFVFAASLRSEPNVALSWSLALLFSGGLIFFYSARNRLMNLVFLLAVLSLSSFPYSPTWNTNFIYRDPPQALNIVFLLAQTFLIFGYIKHGLRKTYPLDHSQRWLTFVYPWGLLILPLMQFTLTWIYPRDPNPTLLESLPGVLSTFLALLFFLVKPIRNLFNHKIVSIGVEIISLNWLWSFLEKIFQVAQKLFNFINQWSETTASTLWAFIILTLLISLFIQTNLIAGG